MALEIFYRILNAINPGGMDLLEFADLAPEDSALILDNLFDSRNHLERRNFR